MRARGEGNQRRFARDRTLSCSFEPSRRNKTVTISKDMKRRFLASLVIGLVVYLGLAVFGDIRATGASLRSFRWSLLPVIFLMSLLNYAFRFARWSYYLRKLAISLPFSSNFTVFMSGLAMSITPGKMGELIKCYFLKQMADVPMRRSVPIVFAERFTDFFSIVVLAALGALAFPYGRTIIWIGLIATIIALLIAMNRRLTEGIIRAFLRLPLLHRPANTLLDLYDHAYQLLGVRPLAISFALGMAAWFCECVGFYITVHGLGFGVAVWQVTFIYAFATFFGAVTLLPGGLGTTEGSLTGLLILKGLPKDAASAATILIRLCTLWFAVTIGLLWIAPNQRIIIPEREIVRGETDD
jgi:uncharacterized protein (TIRG00374 family)